MTQLGAYIFVMKLKQEISGLTLHHLNWQDLDTADLICACLPSLDTA